VFACLGVALALHGRRAVRVRVLNGASAGASVFMNVIAAGPGWRDLAVWTMPPAAYVLASDTLIGVVRASVTARHQELETGLAGEVTLLAAAGGLALWLLRLLFRDGGAARAAGPRPRGSWPWSPNGTGRWPRSRWRRCRGFPPPWRPRSA
jgi:hypothetical protein